MRSKEDILAQMKLLEDELDILRKELRGKRAVEETVVAQYIKNALAGKLPVIKAEELRFAAYSRCKCGAGMCYPIQIALQEGAWYCSAILLGKADKSVMHSPSLPFALYELKSEDQPSVKGATTRE